MKNILEVKDLIKSYEKNRQIVKNISFNIEAGQLVGFIGHNGAGKTTTIKCIVGIVDYENGDILIDDHNLKEDPIKCKEVISYVPDNPDIYESLTGLEYLNMVSDIFNIQTDIRKEKIEDLAQKLELQNALNDNISTYSHGMKQKIVLIAALIHEPKLLILDEPFVGLDPNATFVLKNIMKDLCSKGGAILFSTHILEVVENLCTDIIIIKEGNIITKGKTKDITLSKSLEEIYMENYYEK